jgi:uncharacterized membrane protein YkvA (DUF1232 family)
LAKEATMQPQVDVSDGSEGKKPEKVPTQAAEGAGRVQDRLRTLLRDATERVTERIGKRKLPLLLKQRERVRRELNAIPPRIQKVSNQASLVLELVDDYMDGRYRQIAWRSLTVAALALLYTVSPGDVVPDVLPIVGSLDDTLVLAVAMRLIRGDLERYCKFKGYALDKYF